MCSRKKTSFSRPRLEETLRLFRCYVIFVVVVIVVVVVVVFVCVEIIVVKFLACRMVRS